MNADALNALEDFSNDASTGNFQFLKFDHKVGEFVYGMEENIVEEDEKYAVNTDSLSRGFICWRGGNAVGEVMAPVMSGRIIKEADLEDHGPYKKDTDGWKAQTSIEFQSLDTGETLLFKTGSKGGTSAIGSVSKEVVARVKRGETDIIPIVEMSSGSYKHRDYGKIHTPKFTVIDWVAPAGAANDDAIEGELVDDEALAV